MKRFFRRSMAVLFGALALIAVVGAGCLAAGSLLFLHIRDLNGIPMPVRLWCWALYWQQYGGDPAVRRDLLISIGAPGAAVLLMAGAIAGGLVSGRQRLRPARAGQKIPAPVRAASDAHGAAAWMTVWEARSLFPGPNPVYGGVVVGEAYRVDEGDVASVRFDPQNRRTWGRGGKAPLLIDPCETDATHGLVFAGSGGFKTTAVAIPTLTVWTGSAVILDPSCQLGPMAGTMREAMGHTVVKIGPGLHGFNVLSWIDVRNPLAETHVQAVVDWLTGERNGQTAKSDNNEIFKVRAREMMTCILADLLWGDASPEKKTLREFRARLSVPEKKMKGFLADIHEGTRSPLAKALAGSLMDVFHETFSGIYSNAMADTQWLSVKPYADMLSDPSFDPLEIREGTLTAFIQIPMESLRATPALARVVVGALMNAVYQAEGRIEGRVLFLLDEVNFLGRLKALEDARDAGRKYGMTIVPMWQSLGQLVDTWGASGKASWFNSASWRLFAVVDDKDTAEEISKTCGSCTILKRTEGTSTGSSSGSNSGSRSRGRNEGLSEASRLLISPDEVRTSMRSDEQIVFRRGAKPLRSGRAIYFRRPEMVAKTEADRFRAAAE